MGEGTGMWIEIAIITLMIGFFCGAKYMETTADCPITEKVVVVQNSTVCPEVDCINEILNSNARLDGLKAELK